MSGNGTMQVSELFASQIKREAVDWALTNGLRLPITVNDFQTHDYGYVVLLSDSAGRAASCQFRLDGSQAMYDRLDRASG